MHRWLTRGGPERRRTRRDYGDPEIGSPVSRGSPHRIDSRWPEVAIEDRCPESTPSARSVLGPTLLPVDHPQIVDRDRNRGISGPEGFRGDLEHPLEESFCPHVVARGPVEHGEAVDRLHYERIVGSQGSFLDRKRALCEWNGLVEATLAVESIDVGIERLDFRRPGLWLRECDRGREQRKAHDRQRRAGTLRSIASAFPDHPAESR